MLDWVWIIEVCRTLKPMEFWPEYSNKFPVTRKPVITRCKLPHVMSQFPGTRNSSKKWNRLCLGDQEQRVWKTFCDGIKSGATLYSLVWPDASWQIFRSCRCAPCDNRNSEHRHNAMLLLYCSLYTHTNWNTFLCEQKKVSLCYLTHLFWSQMSFYDGNICTKCAIGNDLALGTESGYYCSVWRFHRQMFLLKEDGGNRSKGLTRKEQSSFVTLRRSLYCTYKIKHEVHVVSFWLTIPRRLCFSRTLEDKK